MPENPFNTPIRRMTVQEAVESALVERDAIILPPRGKPLFEIVIDSLANQTERALNGAGIQNPKGRLRFLREINVVEGSEVARRGNEYNRTGNYLNELFMDCGLIPEQSSARQKQKEADIFLDLQGPETQLYISTDIYGVVDMSVPTDRVASAARLGVILTPFILKGIAERTPLRDPSWKDQLRDEMQSQMDYLRTSRGAAINKTRFRAARKRIADIMENDQTTIETRGALFIVEIPSEQIHIELGNNIEQHSNSFLAKQVKADFLEDLRKRRLLTRGMHEDELKAQGIGKKDQALIEICAELGLIQDDQIDYDQFLGHYIRGELPALLLATSA